MCTICVYMLLWIDDIVCRGWGTGGESWNVPIAQWENGFSYYIRSMYNVWLKINFSGLRSKGVFYKLRAFWACQFMYCTYCSFVGVAKSCGQGGKFTWNLVHRWAKEALLFVFRITNVLCVWKQYSLHTNWYAIDSMTSITKIM